MNLNKLYPSIFAILSIAALFSCGEKTHEDHEHDHGHETQLSEAVGEHHEANHSEAEDAWFLELSTAEINEARLS